MAPRRDWMAEREKEEELRLFGTGGTQAGINFEKYDAIPVEVSGQDPPEPFVNFSDLDLGECLNHNIELAHYSKPTPVQKHAVPISLAGRDLMACAQTGSGKTAAFLFPIIAQLNRDGFGQGRHGIEREGIKMRVYPAALILAPTRELAVQIFEEATKFCFRSGLKVAVVYGGVRIGDQMAVLRRYGCDILVATPGRLHDMLERETISVRGVKFLTLDEADRMLDMGFEPQIRDIVQQRDMPAPGERRTTMFSATFPREIQRLAAEFLYNYLFVVVGSVGTTTDDITQRLLYVENEEMRRRTLVELLRSVDGLTLVFVETKRDADYIENFLSREGFPATSIHGDRSQREREDALASFRHGQTPVLVATDVAARGLDINNVAHVINYNMPTDIERYIHRIGRTGRVGNPGLATGLMNEDDKPIANELMQLLLDHNQEIPEWFERLARSAGTSHLTGGGGGRRGGRGGGHYSFGARDHRQHANFTSRTYTHSFRDGAHDAQRGGGQGGAGPSAGAAPAWREDDQFFVRQQQGGGGYAPRQGGGGWGGEGSAGGAGGGGW